MACKNSKAVHYNIGYRVVYRESGRLKCKYIFMYINFDSYVWFSVLNKAKHVSKLNSFVSHSSFCWETQLHIKLKTNGWELKWATHTHTKQVSISTQRVQKINHTMRMERNETEAHCYKHSLFHQSASGSPPNTPATHFSLLVQADAA